VNVGRGARVSLLELLGLIARALGVPAPEPRFEPERAGDVRHSLADVSRAKSLLGWQARVPLEQGLAETVRWYLEVASR
jgi:nucleoside-diphosphate-sugar epimerase